MYAIQSSTTEIQILTQHYSAYTTFPEKTVHNEKNMYIKSGSNHNGSGLCVALMFRIVRSLKYISWYLGL